MAINDTSDEVCKLALARLGQDTSFQSMRANDQGAHTKLTAEERKCLLVFEDARLVFLRSHAWNFARAEIPCAAWAIAPNCPAGEFRFHAALPADCLKVGMVYLRGVRVPFRITSGLIEMEAPADRIVYTRDEDDFTRWDVEARSAFAWKLAAELAETITGRNTLVNRLEQKAAQAYILATTADASEQLPRRARGENPYARAIDA